MKIVVLKLNNYLYSYKNMNFFTQLGLAFQNIFTVPAMQRFIRVGLGGTFAGMATVLALGYGLTDYASLKTYLVALTIGGIIGFINGIVNAYDKAFRMVDTSPVVNTTTPIE